MTERSPGPFTRSRAARVRYREDPFRRSSSLAALPVFGVGFVAGE
ncbi:hypothetical protein [Micromonospora craterilacus]|nr:hypothetical protein [Micromonospora craterilacus]